MTESVVESYYLGVYWWRRRETLGECVSRAVAWYTGLGTIDPAFRKWFRGANSYEVARTLSQEISFKAVESLIRKHSQFDGAGDEVPARGFDCGLWNGAAAPEAGGSDLTCGYAGTVFPNSCVVSLPLGGVAAERIMNVSVLSSILRLAVDIWHPDYGVVLSHQLANEVERGFVSTAERTSPDGWVVSPASKPGLNKAGWLTYLCKRFGSVKGLPPGVRIEKTSNEGQILIATEEKCTVARRDHVKLLRTMTPSLRAAYEAAFPEIAFGG